MFSSRATDILNSLQIWTGTIMTGRQTMTAWGDPRLLLRQLQAFPTATINGIISAKRREMRASPWGEASSLISPYVVMSIKIWGCVGGDGRRLMVIKKYEVMDCKSPQQGARGFEYEKRLRIR